MADENWDEPAPEGGDTGETMQIAPAAELPEIKLFGRWSCDDVHIADMSLQVIIF